MRVCVKDNLKMEFKEAGIKALEFKDRNLLQPYKLWSADLYICRKCGLEILGDFGQMPYLGEWDEDFYGKLSKMRQRGDRMIEFF